MITMQEWKEMSCNDKTTWLEDNFLASNMSLAKRGLVYGVGVNDAPYQTQPIINGKQVACPAYQAWTGMLERAYSAKYHAKNPTYSGVTVCDEWNSFMAFRRWWIENQVDGHQIDKDLLSDDGVYSPNTCLFVPRLLNTFTIDCGAARGEWPIGVCFESSCGRFRADCGNPVSGKRVWLGYFDTPEEAHAAWRKCKLELALELKPKMDEINLRIYPRVIEIINNQSKEMI